MNDECGELEAVTGEGDVAVERLVQFVFDSKLIEWRADGWPRDAVQSAINAAMADDGYLWAPTDEERGVGTFVNVRRCSAIRLLEKAVDRQQQRGDAVSGYLDAVAERYGVELYDGFFDKGASRYVPILLAEVFGMSVDDAKEKLDEWRECH